MVADPRFFHKAAALSPGKVMALTGGRYLRDEAGSPSWRVRDVAEASTVNAADACIFITDRKRLTDLADKKFAVCLISEALVERVGDLRGRFVVCENAQHAFVRIVHALYAERDMAGASSMAPNNDMGDAQIDPQIDVGASVDATAIIAAGAVIKRGAKIGPYAIIGPGVEVGEDTRIGAHVCIEHALVGSSVTILPGAKVGQAGFGFFEAAGSLIRMPQIGRVIIKDDVEIGANTTIDRGTIGDTIIGQGTCIDNQVQIAHNVVLGKQCLLAAHVGISGSCIVGDGVVFGGRAGLADHIMVGDGARIAANAGCMRDIPAGETWAGSPAQPIRKFMREVAALGKLANVRTVKKQAID